ncbi:hypothetical protein D3C87_2061470 [compost metagenome]
MQDARHYRVTRKVSQKKLLIDRHVFHTYHTVFVQCNDFVDHLERITVSEQLAYLIDIEDRSLVRIVLRNISFAGFDQFFDLFS